AATDQYDHSFHPPAAAGEPAGAARAFPARFGRLALGVAGAGLWRLVSVNGPVREGSERTVRPGQYDRRHGRLLPDFGGMAPPQPGDGAGDTAGIPRFPAIAAVRPAASATGLRHAHVHVADRIVELAVSRGTSSDAPAAADVGLSGVITVRRNRSKG